MAAMPPGTDPGDPPTKPPRDPMGNFARDIKNNQGAFSFLKLDRGKARPAEAFARYSTFIMLFVWAFPMCTLVSWGNDDDVIYWLGTTWWVSVFLLPFYWGLLYWAQARRERPHKCILILAVLGACLVFISIGGDYMNKANLYANQLVSTDCTPFFTDKFHLEGAYNSARAFLDRCKAEGNAESNIPMANIEDCPGYQTEMSEKDFGWEWSYLKKVEARHACVGFCQGDGINTGMWYSSVPAQDGCAQAIGQKLFMIRHQCIWMLTYGIVVALLFIVWGVFCFPTLHQTIQLQ